MRGKPLCCRHRDLRSRITPADAGKTYSQDNSETGGGDHPRGCGENIYLPPCSSDSKGSPPRMRGKRRVCRAGCHKHGITPADAGKTQVLADGGNTDEDHPRGCGENDDFLRCFGGLNGSPPRMRGKLFCHSLISSAYRITPADAGKTRRQQELPLLSRDHPRGCGENRLRLWILIATARITPADAGKTCKRKLNRGCWRDHPRGCGENTLLKTYRSMQAGSPPRMRGKPAADAARKVAERITPADAGKTYTPKE